MVSSIPFTARVNETLTSFKQRFAPLLLDSEDARSLELLLQNIGRYRGPLASLAIPSTTMSLILAMLLNAERHTLQLEKKIQHLQEEIIQLRRERQQNPISDLFSPTSPLDSPLARQRGLHPLTIPSPSDPSVSLSTVFKPAMVQLALSKQQLTIHEGLKAFKQRSARVTSNLKSLCENPDRNFVPLERDLTFYFNRQSLQEEPSIIELGSNEDEKCIH